MISKINFEMLARLYQPSLKAGKGGNGQVIIIGGSSLFHGAPILALKTASRIVDMVFFATPQSSVGKTAENLKSKLSSFIWVPWEETEDYLVKSGAVLIGPGMMREENKKDLKSDQQIQNLKEIKKIKSEGLRTRLIVKYLLLKYPQKRWVIDAGGLQMMEKDWIPKGAILTPNQKEFIMLFARPPKRKEAQEMAKKYQCFIVLKGSLEGEEVCVCSSKKTAMIEKGNAGLTKGGTGDVLAGLTVALAAKNEPFLAAYAASFFIKEAARSLYQKVGFAYNADDLAEEVPKTIGKFLKGKT